MASVFLSYDRDDHVKAGEIAAALEKRSHQVWWDQQIRGGAQYSKEIEQALTDADAVVVLWSTSSVESAWVRDEAAEGRDRGKLIPVALDAAKPPMGFRQFQTIDLSKSGHRRRKAGLDQLLDAIGGSAASTPPLSAVKMVESPPGPDLRRLGIIAGTAAALAAAAAAFVAFGPFAPDATGEISAAVTPLDSSPDSKTLASDLITKLAAIPTQKNASLHLETSRDSKAALLFQVGGSTESGQSQANLLLLDGRSSAVLWSGQFERPASAVGDLRQEMGYTASHVLGCASAAYQSRQLVAKLDVLKSYLEGCAAAAGTNPPDSATLALKFRQIVEAVPSFAGGWAQLLLAESGIPDDDPQNSKRLAADIARARKLEPDLPESYYAQINFLPADAYAAALNLLEEGLQRNPDSSLLLEARSGQLLQVGRLNDAVADAKRAAEIDPTSPAIRISYIYALANSGRTSAAFDELKAAERFWPGSSELERQKYILNSRYGDPAEASAYVESSAYQGDVQKTRIYLQARMHPTPANIDRAIQAPTEDYRAEPQSAARAQAVAAMLQARGIFGRQKDLLDLVMSMPPSDITPVQDVLFRPTMHILWLDPRSLQFAKRIGLLQYWASSGRWPDFCSQPNFPYDCKKEAAKLSA
jgi:adenylate cyclase